MDAIYTLGYVTDEREFFEIRSRWKGQRRPAANYCSAQTRHRKSKPSIVIEEEAPF
jgi:hypothetical protein